MNNQDKIEILKEGQNTKFWKIILEQLNMMTIKLDEELNSEELEKLAPEEYKAKSKLLKAEKKLVDILIDLPNSIVVSLGTPDNEVEDDDPYVKPEDIS